MNDSQTPASDSGASPQTPIKPGPPRHPWPAFIPGLLVAGLGLFFLSHTMGWLPGSLWRYLPLWPWAFLIFIGVRKMTRGGMHDIVIGLLIALVGSQLILQTLGYGYWNEIWRYWPVLLIVGGVLLLLEANSPRPPGSGPYCNFPRHHMGWYDHQAWREQRRAWRAQRKAQWRSQWQAGWPAGQNVWGPPPASGVTAGPTAAPGTAPYAGTGAAQAPGSEAGASAEGWLSMEAFFSENKRRIVTPGFQGGHIVAIFGNCKLDLRSAPQPPGARLSLQANAIFGEVQIYVPSVWKVTVHGAGVFGNFQDNTLPPVQPLAESDVRLDVYGTAAFGQVSVRS